MRTSELIFTAHARERLLERIGLLDISDREIEFLRKKTATKSLCKFVGTDIHFILSKTNNVVVTILPRRKP